MRVVLFLVFEGNSIVAVPVYIFCTLFPAFIVYRFFDDGHSDGSEVTHYVLFSHLYVFFGDMSIEIFCPFFNCVVCFFDIELHELFVYF